MSSTVKVKRDAGIKKALCDENIKRITIEGQPIFLKVRKDRKAATFYIYTHIEGKRKQTSIGAFPVLSLKNVMDMVPNVLENMITDKKVIKSNFGTIGDMFEWYLGKIDTKNEDRQVSINAAIEHHLDPFFGKIKLHDFTKDDVFNFFLDERRKGCEISSIQLYFFILKQIFHQAQTLDLIESNILFGTRVTDFTKEKAVPREGRLKNRNIDKMYAAIENTKSIAARTFNLLCLMNATRLNETRLLKWDEVDFKNREITFLQDTVKNDYEHVIPMTEQLYQLMFEYKKWQQKRKKTAYVFPGENGVITKAIAKNYVLGTSKIAGFKFSCHDYRKLAKSKVVGLTGDHFIGERLLNHKLKGLEAAYPPEEIKKMKLNALNKWHSYLDTLKKIKQEQYRNSVVFMSNAKPSNTNA